MEIEIPDHTRSRAIERGVLVEEIVDVFRNGTAIPAKHGRLGRSKVYRFDRERNGVHYREKKVELYYVMEASRAVAVTVYAFYGRWEESDDR